MVKDNLETCKDTQHTKTSYVLKRGPGPGAEPHAVRRLPEMIYK